MTTYRRAVSLGTAGSRRTPSRTTGGAHDAPLRRLAVASCQLACLRKTSLSDSPTWPTTISFRAFGIDFDITELRIGCGSFSSAAQPVSAAAARQEAVGSVNAWSW